jgi:hypothetical protein
MVFHNSLIINQLDIRLKSMYNALILNKEFLKFFPKLFGKLLKLSYICTVQLVNDNV